MTISGKLNSALNPSTNFLGTLKRSLLIWNPLTVLGYCVLTGWTHNLLRSFLIALLISEIVTVFCFSGVHLVRKTEARALALLGKPPSVHGMAWSLSVSTLIMPLGLHLAFKITGWVLTSLGSSWTAPSLADYRSGILLGISIAGFFFLIRTRADARETSRMAELKISRLEKEHLQAQISALTAADESTPLI